MFEQEAKERKSHGIGRPAKEKVSERIHSPFSKKKQKKKPRRAIDDAAEAFDVNLHRRHLTQSQKGAIAAEASEEIAKELAKLKSEKISAARKGEIPPTLGESKRGPEATKLAAKAIGVSHGYVSDAKAIKEKFPETFEKVRSYRSKANQEK